MGYYSSTVSIALICLFHVSAHLPICLVFMTDNELLLASGGLAMPHLLVTHMNHINIPEYMKYFRAYKGLSLSETSVRQTQVNDTHVQIHTYIHAYPQLLLMFGPFVVINVELTQACPN